MKVKDKNTSIFKQGVIRVISEIPKGSVVSYGQVAAYVGVPRGARQVGWILRQMGESTLPWWRVVNNAGRISIKGHWLLTPEYQKQLLEQERVRISNDLSFDIENYRYRPDRQQLKLWGLNEQYLEMVWNKFNRGY